MSERLQFSQTNAYNRIKSPSGVVQVKSTAKTDAFSMSGTTFTDVTNLSVTITPTSASNKILILADTKLAGEGASVTGFLRLVRDSTAIYLGDAAGSRTRASSQADGTVMSSPSSTNIFVDSPATTSAVTYKVQIAANNASSVHVNRQTSDGDISDRGRYASSITVMEVTP